MISFLQQLKFRNETMFYFGLACLVLSVLFLILAKTTTTQVYGVNAWYKPFKFAFSTLTFAWAMAWIVRIYRISMCRSLIGLLSFYWALRSPILLCKQAKDSCRIIT